MEAQFTLKMENFDVVGFFPYTSHVTNVLLSQNHNYKTHYHDLLESFGNEVETAAIAKGCVWDNKVVVKLKPKINPRVDEVDSGYLFVGYYDNIWSVGLGVWQPNSWTKEYNKIF